MAGVTMAKTSYSDTTPQRQAISDIIEILDPRETPSVAFFGLSNGPEKFSIVNWKSTKVEWLDDTLAPMADALNGSIASSITTFAVDNGEYFKPGDHILIDSEHLWVSSVSTDTLTVTRSIDSGTAASHADDSVVTLIGNARLEAADADYDRALTDISAPYNYTQIFQEDLTVSRTAEKIAQYGISSEWEYQAAKKLPELMRFMNRELFYGVRASGSATAPRMMGGLETFITDNTASQAGAALTQKALEDLVQAIWSDGGQPDTIICNAWVKRKLSSFFQASVRTTRDEARGGVVITDIDTEFGPLSILMDRWCPSTKLYVVSSKYIGFVPYDAFFWEELAKTGDARKGQVVGEYTLVVKANKAHGYIYSISTTS